MKKICHLGHITEVESLKNELKATKEIMWNNGKKLDEAEDILQKLVDGIDNWNKAVEKIIGKQPNYNWPALNEAKEFLKKK